MNIMISSGAKKVFGILAIVFLLAFIVMKVYFDGPHSNHNDWQSVFAELLLFNFAGLILLIPGAVSAFGAWRTWRKDGSLTSGQKWLLIVLSVPWLFMFFGSIYIIVFQPHVGFTMH
jgi:hypothetical protein